MSKRRFESTINSAMIDNNHFCIES
jgi:NAD(P)-dependent dehydrogenase (short-subunit alcohol dehydrogenase family)